MSKLGLYSEDGNLLEQRTVDHNRKLNEPLDVKAGDVLLLQSTGQMTFHRCKLDGHLINLPIGFGMYARPILNDPNELHLLEIDLRIANQFNREQEEQIQKLKEENKKLKEQLERAIKVGERSVGQTEQLLNAIEKEEHGRDETVEQTD